MRALVWRGPNQIQLEELANPVLKRDEVLLRMRAVGICGSDLNGYLGRSRRWVPPLVPGHECSGEIVDAGTDAACLPIGSPVVIYPLVTCGTCEFCAHGREQLCRQRRLFGVDLNGGLAEYLAIPSACVLPCPPSVDHVTAALVEPLAVALHALEGIPNLQNSTCVVYGGGAIGLLVYLSARRAGASRIAVVERSPFRLEALRCTGIHPVIDSNSDDPASMIMDWTAGRGVDAGFDTVGTSEARQHLLACSVPGGIVTLVGLVDECSSFDVAAIIAGEIKIRGTYAYSRNTFVKALALIEEGVLPANPLVRCISMEEGPEVFQRLVTSEPKWFKTVFNM